MIELDFSALDRISNLPNPNPVKYGMYDWVNGYYVCSVCGATHKRRTHKYRYNCPDCGAKVDTEDE